MIRKCIVAIVLVLCLASTAMGQTFYKSPYTLKDGTWGNTHEKTHTVNSKLRQRYRGGCLYILGGTFVRFEEPRFTIADVNRNVRYRGGVSWYLTGQPGRSWNSTPLYLFDEWSAYTNGSFAAGKDGHTGYGATLEYAMEFAYYTATLVRMLPDTYKDKEEIRLYWIWNAKRLDTLAVNAKKTGWLYRPANDGWHAEMKRTLAEFEK